MLFITYAESNDGDISVLVRTGTAFPKKALKLIKKTMDKLEGALEELDENVKGLENAATQIELKNIKIAREIWNNYYFEPNEYLMLDVE